MPRRREPADAPGRPHLDRRRLRARPDRAIGAGRTRSSPSGWARPAGRHGWRASPCCRGSSTRIPTPSSAGCAGRGSGSPSGAGSFWSWREAMYTLVATARPRVARPGLPPGVRRDARRGDHPRGRVPLSPPRARRRLRLRRGGARGGRRGRASGSCCCRPITLPGGIGKPLEPGAAPVRHARHRRRTGDQMDRLAGGLARAATQSLGVVAHSVRAASLAEIKVLHAEASAARAAVPHARRGAAARDRGDRRRLRTHARCASCATSSATQGNLTGVHCTHSSPADMARVPRAAAGGCASARSPRRTWATASPICRRRTRSAAGSASAPTPTRGSRPIEEMRWLEYGQRLRGELRGALAEQRRRGRATTLDAATTRRSGGARRRRGPDRARRCGRISPPSTSTCRALAGVPAAALLDALVFGAGDGAIAGTFVGGAWRPTD